MNAVRRLAYAAMVVAAPLGIEAQRPSVQVVLPDRSAFATEAPWVRSSALVSDGALRDLMHNGFPAHLHYKVERWSTGGWFDDIKATTEWDVVMRYDALAKVYQIFRVFGNSTRYLGSFATLADAEAVLDAPFKVPISLPRRGQRSYYNLVLDIEMLSLTELDEVERWLRGEAKPAVRGQKNPGTAVSRGVKTVFVRLLGGEKRRYEARSGTFRP
ncbi:MAG: DUF4390 domain-containing protein [Gemmatimonadota bacterium]|nr:DUF4390 domain-containing protein [Gemmatimonadota bacterium]